MKKLLVVCLVLLVFSTIAAFIVRMEQTKRKLRWSAEVVDRGVPTIDGESVMVNSIRLRKGDGTVVRQD
jgi:hypothetical protein